METTRFGSLAALLDETLDLLEEWRLDDMLNQISPHVRMKTSRLLSELRPHKGPFRLATCDQCFTKNSLQSVGKGHFCHSCKFHTEPICSKFSFYQCEYPSLAHELNSEHRRSVKPSLVQLLHVKPHRPRVHELDDLFDHS